MMATPYTDPNEGAVRPLEIPAAGQNEAEAAFAVLTELGTKYCRELRRALPFLGRQRARLSVGDAAAYDDEAVLPPVEGPSFLIRLESPEHVWAALLLDAPAVLGLIDGLFRSASESGDESEAGFAAEGRERPALGDALTLAQKALLARLSTDIASPFQTLYERQCQAKLATVARISVRRDDQLDLPDDAIGIDCRVEDVPNPWSIRLFIGANAVRRLGTRDARRPSGAGELNLAAAAVGIPVNVVAELGRITLKLSQVLGLRSGDTLRLPAAANDPVVVRVEGVAKFDAVPVISRGQVAVKIHARHAEFDKPRQP